MRYDVPKSFDDIEPHCDDPDCSGYGPIEDFARRLLKERDELVTKCHRLEKKVAAYREVAIKNSIYYSEEKMYEAATPEKVDAEAQRILDENGEDK